jgi:adenosylhomocysteine nucleosidase
MARLIIVCFAVKEEARFFKPESFSAGDIRTVVTGMGARNSAIAIQEILSAQKPNLVLTCGFAGALNPNLERGNVVFDVEPKANLRGSLLSAGAIPAVFHCAPRVATTAAEKQALRNSSGADVVEMESGIICGACSAAQVPSGTVRVVLDTAYEDLPLDFNALMTEHQQLDSRKLFFAIAKAPWKIAALIRLQKQSSKAAQRLGMTLKRILSAPDLEIND